MLKHYRKEYNPYKYDDKFVLYHCAINFHPGFLGSLNHAVKMVEVPKGSAFVKKE